MKKFNLGVSDIVRVSDSELSQLLTQVYVDAGFATMEMAVTIFAPESVRQRGTLIVARETQKDDFAGMIIVVAHDSPACRRAQQNEVEIHLLGVAVAYRGQGLGKQLIDAALDKAKADGISTAVLWTQKAMLAAQHIYESKGFVQKGEMSRSGIDFLLYEKVLS